MRFDQYNSHCNWLPFGCLALIAIVVIDARAADVAPVADATMPANVEFKTEKPKSAVIAAAESTDARSAEPVADAMQPANVASDTESEKVAKSAEQKTAPVIVREADGFDIIAGPLLEQNGSRPAPAIQRALRAAQFHVKMGSAEHGNLAEFDSALNSLEVAARKIAETGDAQSDPMLRTVKDLRSDVAGLRQASATTFFGRFPLVRTHGVLPETNEEFEVRSYSRPGEAHRRAVHNALEQIAKSASSGPLHVLILVPGENVEERKSGTLAKLVDSQSHIAFANVANVTLYVGSLRAAVDPMPSWNSPDPAFDPICRKFLKQIDPGKEPRAIMLVMVREFVDEAGDDHWIQAQQRTYEPSTLETAEEKPEKLEADKVKIFESLVHDRSRFNRGLMIAGIALFALSLLANRILATAHSLGGGWQRWLAIPTAGFLIGASVTPLVMMAMNRWLPEPQADSLSAAWWPSIAGALSLVLPAGLFRLAAGAAGRYFPGLSCHGRWGIAFVPVALGACAAWTGPLCYAIGPQRIWLILMLGIAASLIVYCFGRAVDIMDEFPIVLTPVPLGLSLLFGAGAFMASPILLAAVIGLGFLTATIHSIQLRWASATSTPSNAELFNNPNSDRPRTIDQLRICLKAPRYQPPGVFDSLETLLVRPETKRTQWIGLVGPAEAGKTAAARFLIEQLRSQSPEVQVLAGRCLEDSPPYQPFREALEELGAAAAIISSHSQSGEVNTIFERLADEFIPFWDFISLDTDEDEGKETSRHDLFEGVVNVLRKLTQLHEVVLFLDDLQWIDEGSAALLRYLHENFIQGDKYGLTVILPSRDPLPLEKLGLEDGILTLAAPSAMEQIQFLQYSLGIEQTSAKHLVKALGVLSREAGSIFWLIRAVSELVTEDALVPSPAGFKLRPSYLRNKQLPVPAAMRAKLGESLRASGQYLPVLECAALLGEKFRVDDVAETLGMDRLLLLQILRHLEQDLQLVRDVVTDQNCYAFSSEFMREIVREELRVGGKNSRETQSPSKSARELHARIAAVLARRQPRTQELIYEIARHYHAAGTAYASLCVDHCLAAAETARRHAAFQSARAFLARAEDCARVVRRSNELAEKAIQIDLEETKITRRITDASDEFLAIPAMTN